MGFKKIASVLASAFMVGSTVFTGFATAAMYPQPFVDNGAANVAIVYGSHAAAQQLDVVSALSISEDLSALVLEDSVTTTPTDADCEGETCVQLDKSNDKINLGDTLTSAFGTNIDKDDLSVMLADGTYTADDNDDFDFEQKITLGADTFEHFRDSDYEDLVGLDEKTPTLGFKYTSGQYVLNYTLNFLQDAESTVTSGDLDDLEGSELTLFGKEYYVSDAKNGTDGTVMGKFTLLDAANSALVNEGETVTVTVGDETYEVSATVFSATEAVLTVNGETSDGLDEGQTYKLSDGTFVGVKDIRYVSKETGVSQVEFSLGNGKIELTSGNDIKINDDTVEGVKSYFFRGTASSDTQKLDKVVIEWKVEDESFITPESSIKMPGFETLELAMEGWIRPDEEKVTIDNDAGTSIELSAPVKDGTVSINLLYANSTGEFKGIGKSATEQLATTNESTLTYWNKKLGENYHDMVVVSYADTDSAESYVISFDMNEDDDAGRNETTIKNEVTGETLYTDKINGDVIDLGDATITLGAIVVDSNNESIALTAGSGTSFNKLYTAGGLKIWLPWNATDQVGSGNGSNGAIFFNDNNGNWTGGHTSNTFWLFMEDEDKDDNIGSGTDFNITIDDQSDGDLEVSQVNGAGSGGSTGLEIGDSDVFEAYIVSPPATRILHKVETSNPDSAEVYYPEGESESYAEVFLKSSGTSLGGGSSGSTIVPILDTEVSQATGKNLIVVGGSCVNTVAAELLGRTERFCGPEWTTATGVGENAFLIKTFERPGVSGKVATLVAGWGADDTKNAATALTTQNVDTAVGKAYTGSTADSITSM